MSTLNMIKSLGAPAVNKANDVLAVVDIDPAEYNRGSDLTGMFFFGNDGKEYKFSYSGHNSSLKAYIKCPPLSAVINRKAQAHINGKTWILNKESGEEDTTVYGKKLRKLLAKPNFIQSWKQFEAQQKIYIQQYGFCIVLPIIPAGYEKYGAIEASSLWNLPPYLLDIKESNVLFNQTELKGAITHIKLKYRDMDTELSLDHIGIFKDFTPSCNTLLFPESRVSLLEMPINNIIGAYESRNELISYAGSQGIISPDGGGATMVSLPLNDKDKIQIQSDFRRQYGLRKGQYRYIISPAAVKWQSMGVKTKDLLLIEEVTESSKAICDGYGYPPHLLGIIDPTFNNQNAAEKGLYQNTIIPEAESMYEEWANFFKLDTYNLCLEKDFSHLAIMQEDKVQQAQARYTLNQALEIEWRQGLITLDQWLAKLGEDPLPNGAGNIRSTDTNNKNVPLATTIGVGGVQGIITVVTAPGMSAEAKQALLEIVFGLVPADAQRMAATPEATPPATETTNPPSSNPPSSNPPA